MLLFACLYGSVVQPYSVREDAGGSMSGVQSFVPVPVLAHNCLAKVVTQCSLVGERTRQQVPVDQRVTLRDFCTECIQSQRLILELFLKRYLGCYMRPIGSTNGS